MERFKVNERTTTLKSRLIDDIYLVNQCSQRQAAVLKNKNCDLVLTDTPLVNPECQSQLSLGVSL
jgi:hypothetical protein